MSDRIGMTDPEILKPLVYEDGRILMMERSAMPTEDCVFTDPFREGLLKLHNFGLWGEDEKAGGIAVYNLTDRKRSCRVSPGQIPELDPGKRYWIWDFLKKEVVPADADGSFAASLEKDGYRWYVFVPERQNGSCLGLADKYAGFTAVEAQFTDGNTDTVILKESGPVTWLSGKRPVRVTAGGKAAASEMESRGSVHTLRLPRRAGRIILTVSWAQE